MLDTPRRIPDTRHVADMKPNAAGSLPASLGVPAEDDTVRFAEIDDHPTLRTGPRRVYGGTRMAGDAPAESRSRHGDPLAGLIGRTLAGRYEIDAVIGRRAGGIACRAIDRDWNADTAGGRPVTLTILDAQFATDTEMPDRLRRAAGLVRGLGHPLFDVPRDIVPDSDALLVVSDHRAGRLLAGLLGGGPGAGWPLRAVLPIGHRIADGLANAHAAGLVHGDLDLTSVLLTADDEVVVLDLALRAALAGDRGAPGDDVLGLARLVHALLTGAAPGGVDDAGPVRPAGLRDSAWQALRQALGPDPAVRPPTPEALMVSLEDPSWFGRLVGRRGG